MKTLLAAPVIIAFVLSATAASGTEPKSKVLAPAEDTAQKTVLIGRNVADGMIVTLEIEGAESMWMPTGSPPKWVEQPIRKGDVFHLEVKPVDPVSKTRLPYAEVKFSAVNRDNKKAVLGTLHPSWGDSGLHYAFNSPLAGDGSYAATVTVGVPGFGRTAKDKDKWTRPISTNFHFKLAGTKIVEVTEAAAEPK